MAKAMATAITLLFILDFIVASYDSILNYYTTVFASIKKEYEDICVVCTSASKTFNLAGLQFSTNFIKNPVLRKLFKIEKDKTGYDEPSLIGMTAAHAAYDNGKPWLTDLHAYLRDNIEFLLTIRENPIQKGGKHL